MWLNSKMASGIDIESNIYSSSGFGMSGRLQDVLSRIAVVAKAVGADVPRLVAVSKTKPIEAVKTAYDAGQLHFGENYVQDLLDKSTSPELSSLKDIRWHFIGHLQSNKCSKLVKVTNLWMVETIDSTKLATTLSNSWSKVHVDSERLKVMIQVNTSQEESKGGCGSEGVVELATHIWNTCPKLELCGLMTIGRVTAVESNPDFILLNQLRKQVSTIIGVDENQLELSMGMSNDFEQAIRAGSTNVRVGSAIFGARN